MDNQDRTVKSDLLKQSLENNTGINGNESSFTTSGPQFGIEQESKFKNWISKYGSSVILPIVALLILAGGIYLYANQKGNSITPLLESNNVNIQENVTDQNIIVTQEDITVEDENIIPEAIKENGTIVEKAIKGNGVTNLSRRALKDYLEDKPQELSNEHKIFIEDYLKDNIGSRPLEVGDEISFSEDLIQQAIDASLELTPEQLKNLEKYSALVAW